MARFHQTWQSVTSAQVTSKREISVDRAGKMAASAKKAHRQIVAIAFAPDPLSHLPPTFERGCGKDASRRGRRDRACGSWLMKDFGNADVESIMHRVAAVDSGEQ